MILLIDNYDSFSYNLYQQIGAINSDIKVIRNDEMSIEEIEALNPSHIVLSPGPGKPSDSGICIPVIKAFYKKIPILGVCLGHQAICEAFGMEVSYASELVHGKQEKIEISKEEIFRRLQPEIRVARYHSLIALRDSLTDCLKVIGVTHKQEIMAIRHQMYPVFGLQFHPESILTPQGGVIIENFLTLEGIEK